MKNIQPRWKSKASWASMFALIFFILKTYGLLEFIGLTADSYQELTLLIFAVVETLGIFNNPEKNNRF